MFDRRLHVSLQITLRPLVIQLICMLCSLKNPSAGKQSADVCVVIWLALSCLFAMCLLSFNCLPDFVHICMSMPCHTVHGQRVCHFVSTVKIYLVCSPGATFLRAKQALCAVAGAGCDSATAGTTTTEVAKNPGPRIVYPAVSSLPRIYRSVANPPSSSFPHQPRAPPMGTHLAQTAVKTCICRLCLIQNRQHLQCMLLDPSIYKTFLICNIQDACILWVFCHIA